MFWSKGPDKKPEEKTPQSPPSTTTNGVEPRRDGSGFDPDKLPPRRQLPKGLQKIVETSDKDESFFDELKDG